MLSRFLRLLPAALLSLAFAGAVNAAELGAAELSAVKALPPDEYLRAEVLSVEDKGVRDDGLTKDRLTEYRVRLSTGGEKGRELTIEISELDVKNNNRLIEVGDRVVVVKSYRLDGDANYYLADNDRLRPLAVLAILFFLLAVLFGGIRGFTSILGLGVSIAAILGYIVPEILKGSDPFRATLYGGLIIVAASLFLAHGFNKRTTVAFLDSSINFFANSASPLP